MPAKGLTVATYAAGVSLATIALIYVFGPTYFIDNDATNPSGNVHSSRKRGVVGLSNPANHCFINSVLQALAGLGDLRLYLIRETYRRSLDDAWVYAQMVQSKDGTPAASLPEWKLEGLQHGLVTKGLKEILDALNERPIYRKTITAAPFVRTLETAFRQRISRQQQDAQEFLQVVAERLCDEYYAGCRAREHARQSLAMAREEGEGIAGTGPGGTGLSAGVGTEDGFPLEGKFESQIECLTCGFKPRPTESSFCTLTLNVPQTSSTSLNACFDGMFKTEYIDDFKCEKCRLVHAASIMEAELERLASRGPSDTHATTQQDLDKLKRAINTDPETRPEGVRLPDISHAPQRRIARHIRLTSFPKIIAIHLSRSIFDASHYSQKNSARVAFPERLPLGGLLNQKKYKLRGLVTHRGSHYSGHYETFRRQTSHPPFSNQNTFQPSDVYSSTASPVATPQIKAVKQKSAMSTPEALSVGSGTSSTPSIGSLPVGDSEPSGSLAKNDRALLASRHPDFGPSYAPRPPMKYNFESRNSASVAATAKTTLSKIASRSSSRTDSKPDADSSVNNHSITMPVPPNEKERRSTDRWWRISDDKIKESSTQDVLGMQREVYLLFYELDRDFM